MNVKPERKGKEDREMSDPVGTIGTAYIVKQEVDTFRHGPILLLSESGVETNELVGR